MRKHWVEQSIYISLFFTVLFALNTSLFSANQNDLNKLLALKNTQTIHLDLSNADLRDYPFVPGKIDLQQANLSHSNLAGVDLSKMNLAGANLSYANLQNVKFKQANLTDTNLEHADLQGAQLTESDLSRSSLSYANLTSANLQHAILVKTNLNCTNLNQADLSGSNFSEANISGATFTNTITANVIGYDSVIEKAVNCETGPG